MAERGETRYAQSGDVSIAYQVAGDGPVDLVIVPGIVSHVEAFRELPGYEQMLARLKRFARVIAFDKRGNGLSDRVAEPPSLFERIDDVRAVLDAAGSRRPALLGLSEGAAMSILFAAEYPERVAALSLFGGFARTLAAPDYAPGFAPDAYERFTGETVAAWGTGAALTLLFGPSLSGDEAVRAIAARCERASATPTALRQLWRMMASIDVRGALARVRAPTLVMHRGGDRVIPAGASRYIAARVARARLVEFEGDDHFPFAGDLDAVVAELAAALGALPAPAPRFPPPIPRPPPRRPDPPPRLPPPPRRKLDARALDRLAALADAAARDFAGPVEVGPLAVLRPLGRGGMGAVFLAHDTELRRTVALKVLRTRDEAALLRFRREALAVAGLSHPNVVRVFGLDLNDRAPHYIMEYAPGGTFTRFGKAPPPWPRALRLVQGAASGLGAAHAVGIVHRDVKPGNLLLVEPDGDAVKVADFGVAKLGDAEPLTNDGDVVGTVGYLSPEQARGEPADARADVFGLGVVLYYLLCGRRPFEGTPIEVLARTAMTPVPDPPPDADLPAAVTHLLRRMTALSPDHRPRDANGLAGEIGALLRPHS